MRKREVAQESSLLKRKHAGRMPYWCLSRREMVVEQRQVEKERGSSRLKREDVRLMPVWSPRKAPAQFLSWPVRPSDCIHSTVRRAASVSMLVYFRAVLFQ